MSRFTRSPYQYAAMVDKILFILQSASPPLQLFFIKLPFFHLLCARSSPMDNYPTPKRPATDASRTTAAGAALLTPGSARPAVTPSGLGRSPLQATPGSTCTLFNARANAIISARIYLLGKSSCSLWSHNLSAPEPCRKGKSSLPTMRLS